MADVALPRPAPPSAIADAASGILVGLSGGLDSTVLLHLLATAPATHDLPVRAIHVCHGLDPAADSWITHCRAACAALSVPLQVSRVDVARDTGMGLEAAAREARHAAFDAELGAGEILALAHHGDDQAETFLLRALRASGPEGLAAMREWRPYARGWLWRPLLAHPRHALLEHARRHRLKWIEDPSNADTSLDRNFLRHEVMPLLDRRWPWAAAAFARSAALCAEATTLLEAEDARALAAVLHDRETLRVAALIVYPAARRARLLRRWCVDLGLPPLPGTGIGRIEADLLRGGTGSEAAFEWSGARIRRWREVLHAGPVREALPANWEQPWTGETTLALPGGGALSLHGADRFDAPVRVHARQGGERIRLPGRSHRHALKHVLQDCGVPPWQRERLPLLSAADGSLLAAGDVAVSADFDAWLRERKASIAWHA